MRFEKLVKKLKKEIEYLGIGELRVISKLIEKNLLPMEQTMSILSNKSFREDIFIDVHEDIMNECKREGLKLKTNGVYNFMKYKFPYVAILTFNKFLKREFIPITKKNVYNKKDKVIDGEFDFFLDDGQMIECRLNSECDIEEKEFYIVKDNKLIHLNDRCISIVKYSIENRLKKYEDFIHVEKMDCPFCLRSINENSIRCDFCDTELIVKDELFQ